MTVTNPRKTRVRPPIGLALAWSGIALIATAALVPGVFGGAPPTEVDPINALAAPGPGHIMGTDHLGRDVLSRLVHGTSTSLAVGLGATAFGAVAGSMLGIIAGIAGRWVDTVVMRVNDVLMAFPGLLLALLLIAILGPGTLSGIVAIGGSIAPGFIRLARAQTLVVRDSGYVRAAVVLGRSRFSVVMYHIVPNVVRPLLVLALANTGAAIIASAALSFLGFGPPPPAAEWGAMLSESRDYLDHSWAIAVFPGLAITMTVVCLNVVGRDLQRRFEGRETHARLD
ncbi:ABC transporter permease [Nocardiopsis exhalans]|uniref:ABC transporter permease n=1 Tax=Nocardiopsis exhalans TaxID=163604 RepID=A0ABY5D5B6_9ACTN|nr:ABC transporter permease [Nocardiopsis exhalans]USY18414.1 ABC transporter permease [Nocardiopsis exhalans]